jgi:hypothetical protein
MESALGRGDDGDKPAVGSGATRTKASPYATPILPPRSFNAKPTPRRGEHGQYRASSTLRETPSGEEVLAFTPPHSIEVSSGHAPAVNLVVGAVGVLTLSARHAVAVSARTGGCEEAKQPSG